MLTLVNTSNARLELKLTARLEGDNGLFAQIREDFQPASPIILEAFESRSLTPLSPEFGLFDFEAIETNVPTRVQQGALSSGILPEGNYTFCVQALDYLTSAPLSPPSPAGCLFIPISYLQPPVMLNPSCGVSVFNRQPSFLWSPPVGNPGRNGFRYDFYLLKLLPGQEPNDAMNRAVEYRAGNPLIIQDLVNPHYVYRMADPPLEAGATYVMQVIAKDPEGVRLFENEGRSEVCTFLFEAEEDDGPEISLVEPIVNNGQGLFTQVNGQLRYHFPGKKKKDKGQSGGVVLQNQASFQNATPKPGDAGLYQITSYDQPLFFDEHLKTTKNTEPLAKVKVKLVIRYIMNGYQQGAGAYTTSSDGYLLPVDGHPNHPLDNGKTLAITYTDAQGNFQFGYSQVDSMKVLYDFSSSMQTGTDPFVLSTQLSNSWENQFQEKHGQAYFSLFQFTQLVKVLRLEVESPYYCSPEVNMLIQPGQSAQVPTQVSEVRSYHLRTTIFGDSINDEQMEKHELLQGAFIEVLRETRSSEEIPADEAQELNEQEGQWTIIGRGETNDNGEGVLLHLVQHDLHNPSDRYRLRASTKQSNSGDYFETDWQTFPSTNRLSPSLPFSSSSVVYNSQFHPKMYETELILQAGYPRIFGRVIQVAPGGEIPLDSVQVHLALSHTNGGVDQFQDVSILSDNDGYFEFIDLPPDHSGKLSFSRPGYHSEIFPVDQLYMGDLVTPNGDGIIKLVPLGKVYGYVSDEYGNPIPADVKLADGPFSPTEFISLPKNWKTPTKNERFTPPQGTLLSSAQLQLVEQPPPQEQAQSNSQLQQLEEVGIPKYRFMFGAEAGQQLPLRIEPFSDKYFPLDTFVNVELKKGKHFQLKADYQFLGEFHLKEKLHRAKFIVKGYDGKLVSGATIEIQDTLLYVGKGIAKYAFASPGQFFLVKVIPPKGSPLASWYEEVEIPISPTYQTIEVVLKKGYDIHGVVTAGPDSVPLSGARVFVKGNFLWAENFPVAEALTDEQGKFKIEGVPVDSFALAGVGMVIEAIEVQAVKSDPLISYIGATTHTDVPQRNPLRLHLDIIDDLNLSSIWGLPIEVESFEPNASGGGTLTGAFTQLPSNENFAIKAPNTRLSFHQIEVIPGPMADTKGIPYARPVEEEILTDQTSLIVRVFDSYTGTMYSRDYYSFEKGAERIVVGHDGAENGLILGNVGILLSSFNFSYQYSGKLILADSPDETLIPVFSANELPRRSYHLVNYERGYSIRNPSFQVHNFSAHADRSKSYILGDSIYLSTVLHTNIPDSKPADLKIEAGEIVVLPETILPFSSGDKLVFYLEEWQVVSQSPWYYSKNQGAIFISKGLVHTGTFDIPITELRLQPNDLDFKDPDLTESGLSLGGVVPLTVYTSDFTFGYDTNSEIDGKPHWKLRMVNEGEEPVAMFTGLPGAENQEIDLDRITLYSNGEQTVGGLDETVRFYDILDMKLSQIATGQGFFKLRGSVDFDIPLMSKDLKTDFTYTLGAGGSINSQWEPLSFKLDTKGQVEFTSDPIGQFLATGMYNAKGTLRIYDSDGQITLKGSLLRTKEACRLLATKVNGEHQIIQLGDPDNRMVVLQGSAEADLQAQSWGNFEFDARLEGFKGIDESDNEMSFVVHGDISATDQDISITDISTPLGGIQMIYNFKEQSLFGSLHVQHLGIGALEVVKGDFQILMDRKGYYFLLGADVRVPIVNTIGMALLVGDYPEFNGVMRDKFESYSYNHNIPPGFEDGFSGFLFNGKWEYELLDNSGFDIGVASLYATAKLGLDLRVSADFSDDAYELFVLGYGNFGLEVSAFCVTGFFLLNAELGLGAQIVNGNFDLIGCASIQAGVGFEVCVPVDPLAIVCLDACLSDCWIGSIKADMVWGESSSTPSFDITLGETCSGNSGAMSVGNSSNHPCN